MWDGIRRNQRLCDMTLSKLVKELGEPFTALGFRTSFRDWVSEETNQQSDVAEAALAHTVANKTEATYQRGNLLKKRRVMMEDWANFHEGKKR